MQLLREDIKSTIFYKNIVEDIDGNVLKLFFIKNKDIFQMELFAKNIIGTWNYINHIKSKEILVNIVCDKNIKFDISDFMNIMNTVISKAKQISYEEYIDFVDKNSKNIMHNVFKKIVPKNYYDKEISKDDYYKQVKLINNILIEDFLIKTNENNIIENVSYFDCIDNIDKNTLCFMGVYAHDNINHLISDGEQYVLFKIIEKYIGANDTDSIYFKYREQGKIYTAVTNYINNMHLFLTGVIGNYDETFFNSVMSELKNIKINDKDLSLTKERLINEIKYLIFEYGNIYVLYPYIKRFGYEITEDYLYNCINKIDASLTNNFLESISIKKVKVAV